VRAEGEVEMQAWSKDGLDRLDELVGRHVGPDGVPGAAWLVARGDEVHLGTAGTLDGTQPVQRDSIFRIASMTKPVTAAAVLGLAEEGVLRLDDPLDRWLPELADRRVMVDPMGSVDDTVPRGAAAHGARRPHLPPRLGHGLRQLGGPDAAGSHGRGHGARRRRAAAVQDPAPG
jgi:CubicO group peptidase (beta-lactamase class C family)